jgi:uncharacterized protein YciI
MFYDYSPDYLGRRGEFRREHLKLAWESHARGELILGGALAEPEDDAVLLFQCTSPDVAERFAANDAYVKNGLVTNYRVRSWTTVVGKDADSPLEPEACTSPTKKR